MDRIDLAQDGNRWQAVVNMAVKLRFLDNVGVALLAEELLASQEGIWLLNYYTNHCTYIKFTH